VSKSRVPRFRGLGLALLLVGVSWLQACQASSQDQARKLDQERKSWENTARLTADLRGRNALPATYAQQTLRAIQEELDKLQRKAEQASP
jgi:hypothetical protein